MTDNYLEFARQLAIDAGKILLSYYGNNPETIVKGKNDVVTAADFAVESLCVERIKSVYPEHKILSEEKVKDTFSPDDYVWIIDPLDGTNNFSFGLAYFNTSIALYHREQVISGVVNVPVMQELFWAEQNQGAFLNGKALKVHADEHDRLLLLGEICLHDLEKGLDKADLQRNLLPHLSQYRVLGALALDLAYVAKTPAACTIDRYFYPWDVAAGALIAEEAGAKVTDLEGRPWSIHAQSILAAHPAIHAKIIKYILP
ncbi:MAG TPA: inositol monophosphatase family protein [bacterium]|nr:inositol monophosphatase family protein [bacterium]